MTGVVAALLLGVAWLIACSPAPARLRRLRRTGRAGRARCVRSRARRMGDALGRAKGTAGRASRDRGIPEALDAFESLRRRHELPRFVDDPRAVGEWRIRVTADGQWNLRCDARLPPRPSPPAST